ncbi:MAG: hypothetical protein ACJ789_01595 [Thermomicrobiales bacterium]
MNVLNSIHVDQMVRVIREEQERENARREQLANLELEGIVAKSRRVIGASFIGAGKLIQGQREVEIDLDFGPTPDIPLNLAR